MFVFFSILVCEKRRKTLPSAGHKVIKKSGLQQVADHIKSLISKKCVTRRLGKGNIDPPSPLLYQLSHDTINKKRVTILGNSLRKLWYHQESNRGHKDFQSFALPTELWHHCRNKNRNHFLIAGAKVRFFFVLPKFYPEKFRYYQKMHYLCITSINGI